MTRLFFSDPREMSPSVRRFALFAARAASWIAPLLLLGMVGAALAHFFLEVGNYPEPKHRQAVGALFLCLFAPVTGAIWYLARQRLRQLKAVNQADGEEQG